MEFFIVFIIFILLIFLLKIGYQLENVVPLLSLLAVASIRMIPSFNSLTAAFAKIKSYEISVDIILREVRKIRQKPIDINNRKVIKNNIYNSVNSIKLNNISFSFPNRSDEIIKDCNIEILKGQKIGIVGPSGSGKSTLLSIVLGFLTPSSGSILVNNIDIARNLESWHLKIGYIPQEIYLYDDTIIKNVALGREINDGVKEKVEKALKAAEIYDYINDLPDGMETNVGDRGLKLSGGQRQRIGIARALYRNPDILILDEATSSLDVEVEKKFIENVFNLGRDKTIIFSTHKFETLKNCDKTYTIKNKKLETFTIK